jgi:hypothetical protein
MRFLQRPQCAQWKRREIYGAVLGVLRSTGNKQLKTEKEHLTAVDAESAENN